MKILKKIILLTFVLSLCFTGCGRKQSNGTDIESEANMNDNTIDDIKYFDEYEKQNADLRVPISVCLSSFESDAETLIGSSGKFSFENCEFIEPKDFDKLVIYKENYYSGNDKTVGEAKEYLIGLLDSYDLDGADIVEKKIRYSSNYDDNFKATDDMSLNENELLITVKDAHVALVMSPIGIRAFSDDVIGNIVKEQLNIAGVDPSYNMYGLSTEYCELVTSGSFEELKDEEYQLTDGMYSVGSMYEIVSQFFEKGTPDKLQENFSTEVANVNVWAAGHNYFYEYDTRRVFNEIPVEFSNYSGAYDYINDWGNFEGEFLGEYFNIGGDYKAIYSADNKGVNGFWGVYIDGRDEIAVREFDQMIDLNQAYNILEKTLSDEWNVSVNTVSLNYINVSFTVGFKEIKYGNEKLKQPVVKDVYIPVWLFDGDDNSTEFGVKLYVDCISGNVNGFLYDK